MRKKPKNMNINVMNNEGPLPSSNLSFWMFLEIDSNENPT